MQSIHELVIVFQSLNGSVARANRAKKKHKAVRESSLENAFGNRPALVHPRTLGLFFCFLFGVCAHQIKYKIRGKTIHTRCNTRNKYRQRQQRQRWWRCVCIVEIEKVHVKRNSAHTQRKDMGGRKKERKKVKKTRTKKACAPDVLYLCGYWTRKIEKKCCGRKVGMNGGDGIACVVRCLLFVCCRYTHPRGILFLSFLHLSSCMRDDGVGWM